MLLNNLQKYCIGASFTDLFAKDLHSTYKCQKKKINNITLVLLFVFQKASNTAKPSNIGPWNGNVPNVDTMATNSFKEESVGVTPFSLL